MFARILSFVATNLLGQVAILIGLITLLGLCLQRKRFEEVIQGTIKATVGVLILVAGVEIFVGGLVSFQTVVSSAFGLTPPVAKNTLQAFTQGYGGTAALVMTVGFLFHLVLTRLFNVRFVYLTGHLMWWISLVVAASLLEVFPGLGTTTLILAGAAIVAVYWTIQPVYVHRFLKLVTGKDEFGYGHTSSFAAFLAAVFGRFIGKREDSSEAVRLPDRISFLKDITVSTGFVIALIMLVASLFASKEVVVKQAGDLNYVVWAIIQGLKFAGGITILLYGVRMFLAEIVPAFRGISTRLIPGARPALDVPVVFPYAPTAVMIGFLSATAVFMIFMVIFGVTGFATIVPPMIMLFFPSGGAAVFGNATGGWRGAVLGGAINGAFLAVGQALTWPLLTNTAPELATLADPDWYIIIWVLLAVLKPLRRVFGG